MRKLLKYKFMNPYLRFMLVCLPIQIVWLAARKLAPNYGSYGPNSTYNLFLEIEEAVSILYSVTMYLTFAWLVHVVMKRQKLAATLDYQSCPACGYDCSSIPDFTACPECGLTGTADRFREIWTNPKAR